MLRDSKNYQEGVFRFNSSAYRHKKILPTTIINLDPFELPPKDLADHLLDLYFKHFYPLLPVMHKKSFLETYNDSSTSAEPPRLLLNAIYALSSRISPDPRVRADPEQPDTAGDLFFERARVLLDNEWEDFTVMTVQSLILLSSHQTGAMNTVRGWLYSGLAFRMMQNLGLNRNCDKWNMCDIEKENRKRCFFCCFVVDRLSSAMFGRTPIIDERDYDTPFPTASDEDDPTIIDNFHQLIKLCGTLGSVLRQLYTVYGRHQLSVMSTPDRVISVLDKELNGWMAKLPLSVLYRPPNTRAGERAPAPALERCQMHMLFYTTLILLHRLFIPGRCQSVSASVFPASAICTYAANKILDIAVCLMEEGRLQHINCYALYFMFTAGTVFINDAQSSDSIAAFEAKININRIMRAMEQVETTWKTSARHSNILGELAGLRDINLEDCTTQHRTETASASSSSSTPAIQVPNSPQPAHQQHHVKHGKRMQQPVFDYGNPAGVNPYDSSSESPERPFDPISMAFWEMPTSFDVDEWNSYLSNNQPPPQQ
ncbi:fungal-specific transcription factor domain-containing protein [Dichotomocladium elegans]|nr:fungal-specific transcription factor domain-containing protein [Dichotomocladium elegans]